MCLSVILILEICSTSIPARVPEKSGWPKARSLSPVGPKTSLYIYFVETCSQVCQYSIFSLTKEFVHRTLAIKSDKKKTQVMFQPARRKIWSGPAADGD